MGVFFFSFVPLFRIFICATPSKFTGNVYADIYESHLRGPSFVMEPPSRLDFSNSSGSWLDCSATGTPHPTIDWISMDSTSVGDVSGVRRVLRNGTLVLLPFSAAAYRQDIHNTIYRCVASNSVGRIISRDVQVRAGELWNKIPFAIVKLSFLQKKKNNIKFQLIRHTREYIVCCHKVLTIKSAKSTNGLCGM